MLTVQWLVFSICPNHVGPLKSSLMTTSKTKWTGSQSSCPNIIPTGPYGAFSLGPGDTVGLCSELVHSCASLGPSSLVHLPTPTSWTGTQLTACVVPAQGHLSAGLHVGHSHCFYLEIPETGSEHCSWSLSFKPAHFSPGSLLAPEKHVQS